MEQVINQDGVYAFLKSLVELGGMYYVDNNQVILHSTDDSPVGIQVGKKTLPIALFKDGMQCGDYVVLNPLVETLGKSPERDWFFNKQSAMLGVLIQQLMLKVVDLGINKKKDVDYEKLSLVNEYLDKLDEKMLKEIDTIRPFYWANIFYDKSSHTAQVQTEIFNEKLQQELGNKIRKRSWEVFRGMMEMIFGTCDIENTFKYTATLISIPKADAILHVLVKACAKLNPNVKKILDIDLHPGILDAHLKNLEKYQKLVNWFATGTSTVSTGNTAPKPQAPFSAVPNVVSAIPGQTNIPTTASVVPQNAAPSGGVIIEKPATPSVPGVGVPVGATVGVNIGQPTVGVPTVSTFGGVPAVTINNPMGVPGFGGVNYGMPSMSQVPMNALPPGGVPLFG